MHTHSVLQIFIQHLFHARHFLDTWDIAVNKKRYTCILHSGVLGVWSSEKQYQNSQMCQMMRNVMVEVSQGRTANSW